MQLSWLVTVAGVALGVAPASAAPAIRYRDDRILIKPRPDRITALMEHHRREGARVWREYPGLGGIQVLQIPPGANLPAVVERYRRSGLVEAAEPDHVIHLAAMPNDPAFVAGLQWSLFNNGAPGRVARADIKAPEGWDALASASYIVVALVDSGVRYTHQDLASNLWVNPGEIPDNGRDDDHNGIRDDVHGINAVTTPSTGDPWDELGHGTGVAGVIGAMGNNGVGMAGVAWRVQLMACKFLDAAGDGTYSDAIECINYAKDHGARIINASFIDTRYDPLLYSAFEACRDAGILVVAAAGNDAADNDVTPYYPASFDLDNLVAVAATTQTDTLASYSNHGRTNVDLAAPGSGIYLTSFDFDTAYTWSSGTSFAAPHVTGALALMLARYPTNTYLQTIDRLLTSVDRLPSLAGRCVTEGRLNLAKALAHWPPVLEGLTNAVTHLQVRLRGEPSSSYILERSTNLSDWTGLVTNVTDRRGMTSFRMTNTWSAQGQFFRGRLVE